MTKTEITPKINGSLRISGDFVIKDIDGNIFDLGGRTEISLCRCGHSGNKPFCDGTHKKIGFQSAVTAFALPPLPPREPSS
jgi:CDGSH-type Zn-finger protein